MARRLPNHKAKLAAAVILAAGMTGASASGASTAGPEVGSRIPTFEAVDQAGQTRTFADLTGENGLLLLFFRSADW